jgi:hypothetical protein
VDTRRAVSLWVTLAAAVAGLYTLAVVLLWLPPLVVVVTHWSIEGLVVPRKIAALTLGALLHAVAFLLLNLYLVRRPARRAGFGAVRACLPSLIALTVLVLLSALAWGTGIGYGLKYQGTKYVCFWGTLNLVFVTGVMFSIGVLVRRARRAQRSVGPRALLVLNFALYAGLLLVLFPYLGEMP